MAVACFQGLKSSQPENFLFSHPPPVPPSSPILLALALLGVGGAAMLSGSRRGASTIREGEGFG